jgi:hypothetical protein
MKGACQEGLRQDGACEIGAGEVGSLKAIARKAGVPEIGTGEVGLPEWTATCCAIPGRARRPALPATSAARHCRPRFKRGISPACGMVAGRDREPPACRRATSATR